MSWEGKICKPKVTNLSAVLLAFCHTRSSQGYSWGRGYAPEQNVRHTHAKHEETMMMSCRCCACNCYWLFLEAVITSGHVVGRNRCVCHPAVCSIHEFQRCSLTAFPYQKTSETKGKLCTKPNYTFFVCCPPKTSSTIVLHLLSFTPSFSILNMDRSITQLAKMSLDQILDLAALECVLIFYNIPGTYPFSSSGAHVPRQNKV